MDLDQLDRDPLYDDGERRYRERFAQLPAVLRDYLDQHRLNIHATGRVFGSASRIRSAAERAAKRWTNTGLLLTLHEARRTYASLMVAADVNAKMLSTFMGTRTSA